MAEKVPTLVSVELLLMATAPVAERVPLLVSAELLLMATSPAVKVPAPPIVTVGAKL